MKGAFRLGLRSARRSVGRPLSTERRDNGQRVEVVHASVEDDAPPPRGGQVPRKKLEERVQLFQTAAVVGEKCVQ